MRVLLATDGSAHSHAAADYLLAMPFRSPMDVDIVSVVNPPVVVDPGMGGMPMDLGAFMEEERKDVELRVEASAEEFTKKARGNSLHSVHTHVSMGLPAREVLRLSEETNANLIVMGAVGHSALERVLLGSISDYVATHSGVSTLVVRQKSDAELAPALSSILVAVSGRSKDQHLVNWLRLLNLKPNVQIHLVRILRLETLYRQDLRQKASQFWNSFVAEAHREVLDLETQLQSMGLNTDAHVIESGHIGEALIEYAKRHDCDLVLTGHSDSGLLKRVFMGSTSRYVLRHAKCSVLTVRDQTHD
jgi:nucleotide-binding universal stress UspA family protein